MNETADRPLSGLTLIESNAAHSPLCLRLANAMAARIAADLGARVLKLEPAAGDCTRRCAPFLAVREAGAQRDSAVFEFLSAGKISLTMPAAPEESLALLLKGEVDGVLAEEGDPILAMARARGVPSVELAGYPADCTQVGGPLSEFSVLALSGLLDMIGDPAREPLRLGGHQTSYAAGLSAFTALAALLLGRDRGLPADHARVSLVETLLWVNWKAISGAQASGRAPSRKGAKAEFQVLRCLDGWIALVFVISQFDAVVKLIRNPALENPKFATRGGRAEHGPELMALMAPWFAARSREVIYALAQANGIPLGGVLDAHDLLEDPQHAARGFVTRMPHPVHGELRMPRLPVLWNGRSFAPTAWCRAGVDAADAGGQS